MALVLKGSAHPHVHPQSEWVIPAFAFPAIAGTHLPTTEGWPGWVGLGGWLRSETVNLPEGSHPWPIPVLTGLNVEKLPWSRPTRYHRHSICSVTLTLWSFGPNVIATTQGSWLWTTQLNSTGHVTLTANVTKREEKQELINIRYL